MNKIKLNKLLILLIISVIIFISLFYSKILLPFFLGAFIAYLLNPLVNLIQGKKLNRNLSSIAVLTFFFGFIIIFSLAVLPIVIKQTINFLERFPFLLDKLESYLTMISSILKNYMINFDHVNFLKDFHNSIAVILKSVIYKLFYSSTAIINLLSLIFLTPIVSWYLLKDWKKINVFVSSNTPKKYKKNINNNLKEIDLILSSFMRGQFLVSIILGIYYFFSFYIIGADYSLFLGVFCGIFSLIPYFGIFIGFVLSLYIIVLQFADIYYFLYIILIFVLAFIFEGYFLSPRIIGEKLGLHPLVILYAVFIFGSLFGLIGIFFAIPISSIVFLYYRKILSNLNKLQYTK